MDKKSNTFLETEPVGKLMAKYAVPCVISLLVAALYDIVDQIFISNADYLGSCGDASNTVVFPLTVAPLSIAVMTGDGSPKFAMSSTLAGALVNIILDPVFIFVFRWGMMGAAWLRFWDRFLVFGVGFALLLPRFVGLNGVLYPMPVSDFLTFAICGAVIVYTCRTLDIETASCHSGQLSGPELL